MMRLSYDYLVHQLAAWVIIASASGLAFRASGGGFIGFLLALAATGLLARVLRYRRPPT